MRYLENIPSSIKEDVVNMLKNRMSMDWSDRWYVFSMRLQKYDHEVLGIEEEFKKVFDGCIYFSFMNFFFFFYKGFVQSIIG